MNVNYILLCIWKSENFMILFTKEYFENVEYNFSNVMLHFQVEIEKHSIYFLNMKK